MKIIDKIDDVLAEWSYKLKNGTPDVKNEKHLRVLERVLFDMGFEASEIIPGIDNLNELKVKNSKGNIDYIDIKKVNPQFHTTISGDYDTKDSKAIEKDPDTIKEPKEKQLAKENEKKKYLDDMVQVLLTEDPTTGMGAGRFNMSKDDLGKYESYLKGNTPNIPNHDISGKDIDTVLDAVKNVDPKYFKSFRERLRKKGDPPKEFRTGDAGSERIKNVLKHYLQTGGVSTITGKKVPFNESQLDHKVSLDNGGKDEPANWEFMESRFNQFKGALTNDVIMNNIKKKLAQTPEQDRAKKLKTELKQYSKTALIDYWDKKFKDNGDHGITEDSISKMNKDQITYMIKGWNKNNPEGSDLFIPRYESSDLRKSGRAGGGRAISKEEMIKRVLDKGRKGGLEIPTHSESEAIDEEMQKIVDEIEKRKGEINAGLDRLEGKPPKPNKAPIATSNNVKEIQEIIIGLGQLLSEVSIWDNKYSIGDKFSALKNTPAQFVKGLPPGEKAPDQPYVKVKPKEDAIEVDFGNGSIVVYMKSEANGKTYKIIGNKGSIKPMFGKMQKGAKATDLKWKDTTLETASSLGLYMDGVAMQQKLLNAKAEDLPKVIKELTGQVKTALGQSDQFASAGAISGKLSTMSLANWYRLVALAAGMTKFKSAVVSFSPNLIHKDIKKYYTAVNKNNLISGIKDNTSDVVISSVPASELIAAIKAGKVTFDGAGICSIEGTGIKFIQVSLKKVHGGAQLGKVYSYLKDKYDLLSTADVLTLAINEEIIDEGLKDWFNKGVDFIKSVGKAFLQQLKALGDFAKKIGNKIKSGLNSKGAPGEVSKLFNEIQKKALKESLITEGTIWEQLGAIGKDPEALKILITNINKQLAIISGMASSKPGFHYSGVTALNVPTSASADDVGKLLSNFQTTFVLRNLLNNIKGDGAELYKKLIDMEKEMIYGKTLLPIYKVYGLDLKGAGTAYTKYPGSEEFVKEKLDIPISDVVVFYLQCNSTGNYLTMNSWALTDIKNIALGYSELIYSKYRMGTNDSGRYSYNFEGTTVMPLDKVKASLGIS